MDDVESHKYRVEKVISAFFPQRSSSSSSLSVLFLERVHHMASLFFEMCPVPDLLPRKLGGIPLHFCFCFATAMSLALFPSPADAAHYFSAMSVLRHDLI